MVKVIKRDIYITEDGREFLTKEEAVKHDNIERIKSLIDFPCKQEEKIAQWVISKWDEIWSIVDSNRDV